MFVSACQSDGNSRQEWVNGGRRCCTASLVSSCQHTPHDVTLPRRGAAKDRQERRVPAADRRPDSACVVLPHWSSTQSECEFLLSMWCCVPFCPMPCRIGRAILAIRWTTSWRRRGTGRSWRVAAACRRSGRNARRPGPGVARSCEPRKSRKTVAPTAECCLFFFSFVEQGNVAGCLRPRRFQRTETCVILFYLLFFFFFNPCGQAIIAAAGWRLWRGRSRAVRRKSDLQISQDNRSRISSCVVLFLPVALTFFVFSCLGECFREASPCLACLITS